jgi:hypothetical protein
MAIEQVILDLRDFLQGISNDSIIHFESGFANRHMTWHLTRKFENNPIGFLSFHHEVVQARNSLVKKLGANPSLPWRGKNDPIPGLPDGPNPKYPGTWITKIFKDPNPPPLNSIKEPSQFSAYFEEYHNEVHSNHNYPAQFGNPQVNVYMELFWCWHALVEEIFFDWLNNNDLKYDEIDHEII